jgi:predicted  nucleic acid-binding Zn-ribbon protein
MQDLIEKLVKLQAIELDRAHLAQEARALPVEITQAQAALRAAERQSAEACSALSREETLRTRLEREVEDYRQKAARFRVQLDAVKTPSQAEAIEHELQFVAAEADRLETDEYASLERSETQEAALAQVRTQVELLAAALETIRTRVNARLQEISVQLTAVNAAREALRPLIDADWLARFDRLVGSRGTGLARAENQQCTGCRMGLRPQAWNQLREGELMTCDSCSRLLYWDPALAPLPKAPQPESIPGAGRALRKSRASS